MHSYPDRRGRRKASLVRWGSNQARNFNLAGLSVLAIVGLSALLVAVAAVWFGYTFDHSKTKILDDLRRILIAGLPFCGGSFGLWRLARRFQAGMIAHLARQLA